MTFIRQKITEFCVGLSLISSNVVEIAKSNTNKI